MHNLLRQQLKTYFGTEEIGAPDLAEFIKAVDATYRRYEHDRHALESSLELNSAELMGALQRNQQQIQVLADHSMRSSAVYGVFRGFTRVAKTLFENRNYKAFYQHTVKEAMALCGAQYGAMLLLGEDGKLVDLITQGLSPDAESKIAHRPVGCGLLGVVCRDNRIERIDDISADPRASQFPPGHPPMRSFIGMPVLINGRTQAVLCLTDKNGGEPFSDEDEIVLSVYGHELTHVLARQQLMEKLERTNVKLQSMIDNNPCVFYRCLPQDNYPVAFISEHVNQLFGYQPQDFVGDPGFWHRNVHPEDLPAVQARLQSGTESGMACDYRFRHRDGTYRWIRDNVRVLRDTDGSPVELLGVATDITERKQAEEELHRRHEELKEANRRLEEAHAQLLQSEKMAAIGQLAAGVAHEINNPIAYVRSNLVTLQTYLDNLLKIFDVYQAAEPLLAGRGELEAIYKVKHVLDLDYLKQDLMDLLRESQEGTARVSQIVQDLKSFSHVDLQEWQWSDLHQGLDSTLNIVSNELKYKATVIKEYGDVPQIQCRLAQLNQVFMNLLVNAAQAIEHRGTIWIRTGRHGDWVWAEVEDTGKGIPEENLHRIFEPFFTTKPVGKGTGLGLSLSYSIINKHGGRIDVTSVVNKGTRFRVWLPIECVAEDRETAARLLKTAT